MGGWGVGRAGSKSTEPPGPFAPVKKMPNTRVKENKPRTRADLKKAICAAWYTVDTGKAKRAVAAWPKRGEKRIEAGVVGLSTNFRACVSNGDVN